MNYKIRFMGMHSRLLYYIYIVASFLFFSYIIRNISIVSSAGQILNCVSFLLVLYIYIHIYNFYKKKNQKVLLIYKKNKNGRNN